MNCAACVVNPASTYRLCAGRGRHRWNTTGSAAIAQVDGLVAVPREVSTRGQRTTEQFDGRVAEHGHGGDVISDGGRHRVGEAELRVIGDGDGIDDGRALREAAEHDLGVGAGRATVFWTNVLASLAPSAARRKSYEAG